MSLNRQVLVRQLPVPALTRLPRPVYARTEFMPEPTTTMPHSHPWVQLSYAIRGVLVVQTANNRFVAPPQRAIWIPAGVEHAVLSQGHTEMRSLYLDPDVCTWAKEHCRVLVVTSLTRELIRRFGELPVEYTQDSADGRLAQVLLDQLEQAPEVELSLPWPKEARLQPLCQHLHQEPDDDTPLRSWAQRMACSEKTLSRLFVRETGLTFRAWRQRLRLLTALTHLEQGLSVTEVALVCGYNSTSAFIAAFSQLYGCTPGVFIRQV